MPGPEKVSAFPCNTAGPEIRVKETGSPDELVPLRSRGHCSRKTDVGVLKLRVCYLNDDKDSCRFSPLEPLY
jgi:hypothetical protein